MSDIWVLGILLLHGMSILAVMPLAAARGRRLSGAHILFFMLLPVFGAAAAVIFALANEPSEEQRSHLMRAEKQEGIMTMALGAEKSVPLEEALMINSPRVRRELMLSMLRSDPRKHLDLLVFARFNMDPETAHYATATLTEVQRQIQLEMQKMQADLSKDPDNTSIRISYIQLMDAYIKSGLLEGHLLDRQRLELKTYLDSIPQEVMTQELASLKIRNLLTLHHAAEARTCGMKVLARWPRDEKSWLEMIGIYVETHDEKGMMELKDLAGKSIIDWSASGRDRAQYVWGAVSRS